MFEVLDRWCNQADGENKEQFLKEGFAKASENQDTICRSTFAFSNRIEYPFHLANLKLGGFIGLL